MKITRFIGENVYGYLPINLVFNNHLSIITGINGSGKTTALVLIEAVLCPNLTDLLSIPFDVLHLEYTNNSDAKSIRVYGRKDEIIISHSDIETRLIIKKYTKDELELLDFNLEKPDFSRKLREINNDHPILKEIRNLPSPVFIGLERKGLGFDIEREEYFQKERNYISHKFSKRKREFKGTLSVGLQETEMIVTESYRNIKIIEDRNINTLKDSIILSSFDYIPFDDRSISNNISERKKLLSRRAEIEEALYKIGYGDNKTMKNKLDDLFTKLGRLIHASENENITIEWLINKSQIDRLIRVLDIIDMNNAKIKVFTRPFDLFLSVVNKFLNDSNKKVEIDNFGQLSAKLPNGQTLLIDRLSSGEQQLVIIFANIIFNNSFTGNRRNILIIDEPELSLHIRWQEQFIDSLLQVSADTQFVIATHSPDIVGEYKNLSININDINRR